MASDDTEQPETEVDAESHARARLSASRFRFALMLCVALFLYLALFHYANSGTDDAFISLWAGEQLAAGHGFVNHNGQPLEICSSTLHACLIALFASIAPGAVFTINKLAGMVAGALILFAIHVYRRAIFARCPHPFTAYFLSLLALAVNPALLYWSLGGLETPYAALILTVFGCALTQFWIEPKTKTAVVVMISQSAYTVIRPEGVFVLCFMPVFVAFYWWFKEKHRLLPVMLAVPVLFFGAIILWRWQSFGMIFPNPVYAKAGGVLDRLPGGWSYLVGYLSSSYFALLQAIAIVGLTVYYAVLLVASLGKRGDEDASARLNGIFLYGLCVCGAIIVVVSGGDWMALARFVVPFLPILAVVTVVAIFGFSDWAFSGKQGRVRACAAQVIAVALLAVGISTAALRVGADVHTVFGLQEYRQEMGRLRPYDLSHVLSPSEDLDTRVIGLSLRHRREMSRLRPIFDEIAPEILAQRGKLTVLTTQMGIFPYTMKKHFPDANIEFIDLKGLCTPEIARMDLGRSRGGVSAENLMAIFPPNDGELSRFIHEHHPDLVFVHVMNDREAEALRNSGWVVVENDNYRNIAYRPINKNPRGATPSPGSGS